MKQKKVVRFKIGDKVVKTYGRNKGRRAIVAWVGKNSIDMPIMHVRYQDSGTQAYWCRARNFKKAKSWKESARAPNKKSIAWAKVVIGDQDKVFTINGQKYIAIYNEFSWRIMKRLEKEGYIKYAGKLSNALRKAGISWANFREEVVNKRRLRLAPQRLIYRIFDKDITKFSW